MTVNNWGQARKTATTILEGDFPAVVTEAKAGKSSGDKEQLKLKLRITSGPYVGRTLFDTITISPESPVAMKMFFLTMDAFRLDDAFFSRLPDGAAGTAQIAIAMQGKEITVTLKKERYQEIDREKVKGYAAPTVGGIAGALPGMAAPIALAAPVLAAPLTVTMPATAPPVFTGGEGDSEEAPDQTDDAAAAAPEPVF